MNSTQQSVMTVNNSTYAYKKFKVGAYEYFKLSM